MRDRRTACGVVALAAACVLAFVPAALDAFIPRPERVLGAAAGANAKAGRSRALKLELQLRIAEGDPVGRGELVTHPQGLARLELRGSGELVERHVLQGTEHQASRNGRSLERPRAFLPPLFLLQADTGAALSAALRAYGVQVSAIGLAPCGELDCYVLGDPRRTPPAWVPESAEDGMVDPLERFGLAEEPEPPPDTIAPGAVVWLSLGDFELRRIVLPDGVVVRLGPKVQFEQVVFPSWVQIEEPGRRPARLEIQTAVPVNAPAPAFGDDWLLPASPAAPGAAGEPSAASPAP